MFVGVIVLMFMRVFVSMIRHMFTCSDRARVRPQPTQEFGPEAQDL